MTTFFEKFCKLISFSVFLRAPAAFAIFGLLEIIYYKHVDIFISGMLTLIGIVIGMIFESVAEIYSIITDNEIKRLENLINKSSLKDSEDIQEQFKKWKKSSSRMKTNG